MKINEYSYMYPLNIYKEKKIRERLFDPGAWCCTSGGMAARHIIFGMPHRRCAWVAARGGHVRY